MGVEKDRVYYINLLERMRVGYPLLTGHTFLLGIIIIFSVCTVP